MSVDSAVLKVVESVVKELIDDDEMFTAHMVTKTVRDKGHFLKHDDGKDAVHDLYARGEFGIAYTRTQINVGQGWPWLYHKTSDDPATFGGVYGGGQTQVKSSQPAPQSDPSTTIKIPSNIGSAVSSDDGSGDDGDGDGDDDGDSSLAASPVSSMTVAAPASMMTQNGGNNGHAVIGSQVNKKTGRRVDARQTLSIPACLVRDHLQVSPGDKVYVVAGTKQLELCKSATNPLSLAARRMGWYTVDHNSQIRITQAKLRKAGIGGDRYDVDEQSGKIVVKLST